jgi:FMN phosphatase YigB (HAD superfamily)
MAKPVFRPQLLILDLDNTLCDTFHTISRKQWETSARILEREGHPDLAKRLLRNFGRKGFLKTIEEYHLSARLIKKLIGTYDKIDISPLRRYPDGEAILALPIPKILVTRGERPLQEKKLRKLKLAKEFIHIYITPTFEDKAIAFRKALKATKLKPKDVLVIGDRIDEEIVDAERMGIPTIWVRRTGQRPARIVARPTRTVRSLRAAAKMIAYDACCDCSCERS